MVVGVPRRAADRSGRSPGDTACHHGWHHEFLCGRAPPGSRRAAGTRGGRLRRYHRNASLVPLATAPQPTLPPTVGQAPAVQCPPRRGSLCSWPPATPNLVSGSPGAPTARTTRRRPRAPTRQPSAQAEPAVRRPRVAGHRHPRPPGHLHQRAAPARRRRRAADAAATDAAATETQDPEESQRMVEIEAPAAPAAAPKKPSKLMADLSAAIRATAASARDQALQQLDADAKQVTESIREGATEGERDPAQAVRRRHRRDPRLVQGRDRPDPRGDGRPDRHPQGDARGRARGARGVGRTTGSKRSQFEVDRFGRHGRVLRPPGQRGGPVLARDDGRGDARPAVVRGLGRHRHAGRHRRPRGRGDGRGRRAPRPSRRPSRSRTPPRR